MPSAPYPVLEERSLPAPLKRVLRASKRLPEDLPRPRPGTVLVFEVNGRREVLTHQHLTGTEFVVVNAVGVSVVSIRKQLISVDLSVPSRSAADEFLISVDFRCHVTDPQVVAEAGLTDLVPFLREHLGSDHDLLHRCAQFDVEDIAEARTVAVARISAFCQVRTPRIAGIDIDLATVRVYTPRPLQDHATTLRDERWDQETADLRRSGERADVDYHTDVLRDPETATALAVSRRDIKSGEVVDRLFRERDERRGQLMDLMKSMAASGRLDRVPIDEKYLVDSLTKDLTGGLPATEERPVVTAGPQRGLETGAPSNEDDPDRPVVYVNEDELADD